MFKLFKFSIVIGFIYSLTPDDAPSSTARADQRNDLSSSAKTISSLEVLRQGNAVLQTLPQPVRQRIVDEAVQSFVSPSPVKAKKDKGL